MQLNDTPGRTVTVQSRSQLNHIDLHHSSAVTSGGQKVGINQILNNLFQEVYARLCFSLRTSVPCQVSGLPSYRNAQKRPGFIFVSLSLQVLGLCHSINILEDQTIELLVTGTVIIHRSVLCSSILCQLQMSHRSQLLVSHFSFIRSMG